MCGIVGIFSPQFSKGEDLAEVALSMVRRLRHRGPDDEGVWTDLGSGVALAHRRLSILDLSPAGHQPMASTSGRYVMVFNGEIYNHLEIRRELDEVKWRGHSDTETMLAAIAAWGLERTLRRSVGMFAIALWDRKERTLYLARDRMGEKPLYYGLQSGALLFASELKALRAYPGFRGEVNRQALTLLLRHNAIPAPYSIYQGMYKLLPGTVLKLSLTDVSRNELPVPRPYWSIREVAEEGQRNPFTGSDVEAGEELERLLRQSIASQMIADVPLGAFLSGGIDSSSVVALMQAQSGRSVRTFTIGFNEWGYNEAEHARAVAAHLGTEHTELYVSQKEAMEVIPRLPELYDEPFADSSQIPTVLLSELARRHVTVSLSGDGGDELFGGYNRYFWVRNVWRKLGWMPRPLRAALAGVLTTLPPAAWNAIFQQLGCLLPARLRYATPGDKLHKVAEILAERSPEDIYLCLVSHWKNPAQLVPGSHEPTTLLTDLSHRPDLPDFQHHMMYLDQMTYLPNDILTKVDRAAMAVSLETRVPLLDHRVVEFAWSLPLSMKIRHDQGKWLLRQVLYKYVPKKLIERPKMGFGVPIDSWLRGPLRDWAEALLDEKRLQKEGFFHPQPIREKWAEHLSGRRNWQYLLWDVLMFQAWLDSSSRSKLNGG